MAFGAAPPLEFAPADPNYQSQARVLPLANGQTLLIGGTVAFAIVAERSGGFTGFLVNPFFLAARQSTLTLLDSSGAVVPNQPSFGGGATLVSGAALDSSGNIWIAGETSSDDFPLVAPLFAKKLDYQLTAFVAKLDPTASTILFSTFLGGVAAGDNQVTGIAVDPAGNVYVAGSTSEADFPTTLPVFGSGSPSTTSSGTNTYAFVARIEGDGSKLTYSVLLGGSQPSSGISGTYNSAQAVAVDASGNVTVGGTTLATDFPTTAKAFQTACTVCPQSQEDNFITRISSDGTSLVWSTYFAFPSLNGAVTFPFGDLELDAAGNVYIGSGGGELLAVITGVLSLFLPSQVAKLSADGSTLAGSITLGESSGITSIHGMTQDPSGNLWVTGSSTSPAFPSIPGELNLGNDFAMELNADATAATQIFRVPSGSASQPPAFDSDGNLVLLSSRGAVLRLNPLTATTTPAVFAIANAATLTADGGFGAGELVTLFGVGLGPVTGVAAAPDANGIYPTQLGGVSVSIAGVAAPLLYVGANQINLQVPFQFLNTQGPVVVTTPTGALAPFTAPSTVAGGIFQTADGYAAALNQDQTVNSATNPALPGSIVTIFATGLQLGSSLTDGAIWKTTDASPLTPFGVEVTLSPYEAPLNLFYAGPAPGLINGIYQFNVQLPPASQFFNSEFTLVQLPGTLTSNYVQVYTTSTLSGFIWAARK